MAASRRAAAVVAALAAAGLTIALVSSRQSEAQQQEPAIGIQYHAFTDSRGVTVLSPEVSFDKDFTDRTGIRTRFGVDAISAASDSCIRCHRQGAQNQRGYASSSLVRKLGNTTASMGGEVSLERFYSAYTAMGSVSQSLNNANTTVAGGFSFSLNRPKLHPSKAVETQFAQNAYVSVTQTLTRKTIGQVGYELGRIDGFQSNPFLRAVVDGVRIVGVAPDLRLRHTATARIRQALGRDTFAEADYRFYTDSWDIRGHSVSAGLSKYVSPSVMVSGTYRRYTQTGASFYQPTYTGSPEFFTADFRLFPFDSNLYTTKMVFTPGYRLLGLPEGSGLTFQYEFYQQTNGLEAATFSTGLRVPLKRP